MNKLPTKEEIESTNTMSLKEFEAQMEQCLAPLQIKLLTISNEILKRENKEYREKYTKLFIKKQLKN